MKKILTIILLGTLVTVAQAQRILTLDSCRKLLLQPKKSRGTDCQKQDDNLGWLQRDTCRI